MASVLGANPVRDVAPLQSKERHKGAVALTAGELSGLLAKLRASTACVDLDLTDPVTVLAATGLRRSELLGLRWSDVRLDAGTVTVAGKRRTVPYLGEQVMVFPSTAGTWCDSNNFGKQWRMAREDLRVPEVTPHSFRKTVADLIDAEGLSARIGADQLGTPT